MPWASPAPMLEQFVGTFTKPGAKRIEKLEYRKKKIDIVNDYRLRWRDTVRKGKYQNGAGWLTSLGQEDMQFFIDEGKKLVDNSPKANLDGYFSSPLRLVRSKKNDVNNFHLGISPRLINIVDYITTNSKKWESGWMKHFSYSYPKGFEDDCFYNRTDKRQCGLYEVFRVITTDNDNAYCIRQLYSMGVGLKSVLNAGHQNQIKNGRGYNFHPEVKIDDVCNLHLLETDTVGLRSAPFIYPGLIKPNGVRSVFKNLKEKMMNEFPLEDYEEENLSEGFDLFAIPLNLITMKTGDMSPIAIRKQKVDFGDYVCLIGDIENEGYEVGVSTVQRRDRRVHDVVISPTRDSGFIHLSQMDGAFGTNRKSHLQKESLNFYSKEALERERLPSGNLPAKPTRVMENMTAEEMVNMMTGISVADAEGMDIGKTTQDITDPNSPIKIEFIPTWKDNRKTIEIKKGSAFSDYVRCYVCNQKHLISLPANNKVEEMECSVCPTTDGLKVGHLVEGNPGIVVSGSRPYR